MGLYINAIEDEPMGPTFSQKVSVLKKFGAKSRTAPTEWKEGLVCVVNNGMFAAAGYAHSPEEMKVFNDIDGRTKLWFDFEDAKKWAS